MLNAEGKVIGKLKLAEPDSYAHAAHWRLGIQVDAADRIWVADKLSGDVRVLTSDGKLITRFGFPGYNDMWAPKPSGISFSAETPGRVFVLDGLNKCVYVCDFGAVAGHQSGKVTKRA